jgi:hypothetical protein
VLIALLCTAAALASPWETRVEFAAHAGRSTNGLATVAGRSGPWELSFFLDTLEAKYAPSFDGGRAWVAARAEFAMAGLLFNRWQDGAPAPELGLFAFYQGVEGGGVAYLPGGLYVGGEAVARVWEFAATPGTEREVPGPRPVLTAHALLGVYHTSIHAWVIAGTDWSLGFAPHVRGTVKTSFSTLVRPRVELHAGWADGTDELTASRLGGITPHGVPLAGAAWAEFYVEDYAVARLGPEVGQLRDGIGWSASLTTDLAWFDGRKEAGFAAWGHYEHRGRYLDLGLGYAPWLPRPGSIAMTGWVQVGVTWGKGWGPRPP